MKSVLRKISFVLLAIVAAFSFSFLVATSTGCNKGSSSSGSGNTGLPSIQLIKFEQTDVSMIVGDEKYVVAVANDTSNEVKITYKSSDESVLSVDQFGKFTANKKGTAVVTASYSYYSATCNVTVGHGNFVPVLNIDNVTDNTISVPKGTDYELNPYVIFNGKKFTNATYNFKYSGNKISVNNLGKITANEKGEVKLTVTASWDGFNGISSLSKTLTVKVTNFISIFVNEGNGVETLYNMSLPTLTGSTAATVPFVVGAIDNQGQVNASNIQVEVVEGSDVVSYADGKLSSLGLGDAKIKITVSDFENEIHVKYVDVSVERAMGDYSQNGEYIVVDMDTLTGDGINLSEIFGEDVILTDAYLGKTELEIDNNKIVGGVEGFAFGTPAPVVLTLYTADRGYNVKVLPYVYKNAQTHAERVEFSSYDGVLPLETIFGNDVTVKEAYLKTEDGERKLNISEDGKGILGVDSGAKPTEFTIAVATDTEMKYVDVTAYTLIIDEMSDFDYFAVKPGTWSWTPNKYTIYSGLDWNGYYVLANDIDASEYAYSMHSIQTLPNNDPGKEGEFVTGRGYYYQYWGSLNWGWARFGMMHGNFWESQGPEKMGLTNKGFQGTFDGRGHTIFNYNANIDGLFGPINGGVIKNVAFKNSAVPSDGMLGGVAFNGAIFENIYVETNPDYNISRLWSGSCVVTSASNTCTWKNVVVYVTSKGKTPVGPNYGILAGTSGSSYSSSNSGVFIIADNPLAASYNAGSITSVTFEAEYVDGVKQEGGNTASGIRRYNSLDAVAADKEANAAALAKFNPDFWTILGDAIPVFTTCLSADELEIYIGDELADGANARVFQNTSNSVNVRYQGLEVKKVDSVEIISGDTVVETVDNCTLSGLTTGKATIKVTYSLNGVTLSREIVINSVPEVKPYVNVLEFSARQGLFMDDEFDVVSLEDIFGKEVEIFAAYDKDNNPLTIDNENGLILDLITDAKEITHTTIDLYTDTEAYRVTVNAYASVIKEAEDLEIFKITVPWSFPQKDENGNVVTWSYNFADGDFCFDGYYLLANDIDATGYVHNVINGTALAGSINSERAWQNEIFSTGLGSEAYPTHGFIGTFDGNGHLISNLTTRYGGLFGIINKGTIKNIGIVNHTSPDSYSGIFADQAIRNATFDNVYISSEINYTSSETYLGMLVNDPSSVINVSNVVIEDYNTYTESSAVGSMFGYFARSNGNTNPYIKTYGNFQDGAFKDVYVISKNALFQSGWSKNNPVYTATWDGEYVDGVKTESTYTRTPSKDLGEVTFDVGIPGVRRYTSSEKMMADVANVNTSGFNTEYWNIVNGLPKFKAISMSNYIKVYLGDQAAEEGLVTINNDTSYEVNLRIDGIIYDQADFTVTLTSGNSISVDGKTVTSGKTASSALSVLTITDKNLGTFVVSVDVVAPTTEYGEELVYSARTGEFFKGDTPIEISDIFGKDVTLIKAYDKDNNLLSVDNNVISGVATSNIAILSDELTLVAESESIKVKVKAVALVIDEAEDLYCFQADSNAIVNTSTWTIDFASADALKVEGYYMLVKNIDASVLGTYSYSNGYTVNLDSFNGFPRMDYLAAGGGWHSMGVGKHGFIGTLDGNGYTISNLTTDPWGGLLGAIYSGTVKNIAFVNCGTTNGSNGAIALGAAANAKFENVYVSTPVGVAGSNSAPLVASYGHKTTFKNVVIVDNTSLNITSRTVDVNYGSLTHDARRWSDRDVPIAPATFYDANVSNLYVISEKPFAGTVAKGTTVLTTMMDARYVDGQLVDDLLFTGTYGTGGTAFEENADLTVANSKRYTSAANMLADVDNNDFTAFDTSIWEVVNGVPRFKSIDASNFVKVAVNGVEIGGNYKALLGDEITLSLVLDGEAYDQAFTISAVDTSLVTIDGTKITASNVTIGSTVINVTVGTQVIPFILEICEPTIVADGEEIIGSITLRLAKQAEIDFVYNGSSVQGTVTVQSDSSVISINGTTIVASTYETGKAEVTATIVTANYTVTKTFSVIVNAPVVLADGVEITDINLDMSEETTITLYYDNTEITDGITIAISSEIATASGNVITASATNGGFAEVTITYDGLSITLGLSVLASDVEDVLVNPYFSAVDGVFFNESLTEETTVEDLLGTSDPVIAAVAEDGTNLTVSNGKILGVETVNTGITDTIITLYTANKGYNVSIKAYTLIIDQASDMSYFTVKDVENYGKGHTTGTAGNYKYIDFAKGDVEWDGYYIMINDIDFLEEGYSHKFDVNNVGVNFGSHGFAASNKTTLGGLLGKKGLMGTFDGNGYTMNNVTVAKSGFFGVISGTVKNVRMTLVQKSGQTSNLNPQGDSYYGKYDSEGILCAYVLDGGLISDVYIDIVSGSMNSGYGTYILASEVSANATLRNMIINYSDNGSQADLTAAGGPAFYDRGATIENVYYISPYHMNLNYYQAEEKKYYGVDVNGTTNNLQLITQDARYVDGVDMGEGSVVTKTVYQTYFQNISFNLDNDVVTLKDGTRFTSYEYTTINGIKRYSNYAKMTADYAANAEAFKNFNKDVWEIVNGVPKFAKSLGDSYKLFLGNAEFEGELIETSINKSFDLSVRVDGSALEGATLVENGDTKLLTINGTTATANVKGETSVTITYKNFTKTINVKVYPETVESLNTYKFSAVDGLFFDGETEVKLNDIFDLSETSIVSVLDAEGNALTYDAENDLIKGVSSSKDGYVDGSITVYTADDKAYKVNVQIATLIINEVSDLEYFKANGKADYPRDGNGAVTAWNVVFDNAETNMVWDGYYVLANDIDATGYTHDLRNGYTVNASAFLPSRMDYLANSGWYLNAPMHGLMGTFDGQGHTISNLTTISGTGLFAVVNGATIKNVGFVNCNTQNSAGGFLAYGAIAGTKLHDVYVSTASVTPSSDWAPIFTGIGHKQFGWSNVVIIDNTTDTYTNGRSASSFTDDIVRHSATSPATFGHTNINIQPYKGVYIVSNKPLQGEGNGTSYVAGLEARYVDGQVATLVAGAGIANVAEGSDLTVEGIYRYTTYAKFVADAANRDFSGFSDTMWTMIGGVPSFNSAVSISNAQVYLGNSLVDENGAMLQIDSSADVTFRVNGYAIDGQVTLQVVEGTSVTVSGATVTAGNVVGDTVISATFEGVTKQFTVSVVNPVETLDIDPITFSAMDGVIDYEEVLGTANPTILKATDKDGNVLTVGANNQILGLATSGDAVTETQIVLYMSDRTVAIPVNAYSLIIDEVSDFTTYTTSNGNGYYLLAKDLDFTDYTIEYQADCALLVDGLSGTFDGNGYTISNVTLTSNSVFPKVNAGIVKNLAVTNLKHSVETGGSLNGGNNALFVGVLSNGATVTDCSIDITQKKFNSAWNGKWVVFSATEDSKISNSVVYWDVYYDNTGSQLTYGSGTGAGMFVDNIKLENVILVSPFELNFGGYQGATIRTTETASEKLVKPVTHDAAYVDGVVPSTTTSVYYDPWNMQNGYKYDLDKYPEMQRKLGEEWGTAEYTITLIQGIKRYSSVDTLISDAANNTTTFANFNRDVWEIVSGVPMFVKGLENSYKLFYGNAEFEDELIETSVNKSFDLTVRVDGAAISGATLVENGETKLLTINGTTATANAKGETSVTITYRNFTKTINVKVYPEEIVEEKTYKFSAEDGLFFDGSDEVKLNQIFDLSETTIVSVVDAEGNALTYDAENDLIKGVSSNKDGYVDGSITVYTADKSYKVNVQIATLIINEVSDLAYFKASANSASYGKQCFGVGGSADNDLCDCIYAGASCPECGHSGAANEAWTYYWSAWFDSADDMKWQGYYVLANNIDATGYTHDLRNGFTVGTEAFVPSRYDYLANTGWYNNGYVHGFGGTFDGQGYTISNLQTIASYGLFGIINGGTVQNVGFVNCNTTSSSKGFLAQAATQYSVFKDVYVSTPAITPQSQYTPLVTGIGHFGWNWERVVIIDNTTLEVANGRYYGSITADAERHVNNKPATFGYSLENVQPFKGTYVVSNKPMSAQGNGTSLVASLDARYVDGEEITLTASSTTGTAIVKTNISSGYVAEGADLTVGGIYRYTTYAKFVADAANRDFSGFSDTMWTMIGGVPSFNSAISVANAQLYLGDNVIGAEGAVLQTQSTGDVTFRLNGYAIDKQVTLRVVEGTSATVNGATVTASTNIGDTVIEATCDGVTKQFTVSVMHPVETLDIEPITFSAMDGVIDYEEVLGTANPVILKATDKDGNVLTVDENNNILGLATRGDAVTETQIVLYMADRNVAIPTNAYTLVIDEASDLELFTLKGSAEEYTAWNTNVEGDFEWDGYYILGQDIDCTEYTHDFNGETTWNAGSIGVQSMKYLPAGKGLTGTFDGNGYSIANIKFGANSLFGIVNGGVVKNARMTITTNGQDGHGSFASFFINEGKMQDCIIEQTSGSVNSRWAIQLVFYEADATATFERIVVHYSGSNTAPTAGMFGLSTNDAFDHFVDSIFISSHETHHYHPVHVGSDAAVSLLSWADCADCAGTGLVEEVECATCAGVGKVSTETSKSACKVVCDAKYVDGVERSNQESSYYRNGLKVFTLEEGVLTHADGSTSYEISLVEGIRRYTSFNALTNDVSASLQTVLANYTSSIWTITNNRPVFAKTTLA